jgi:hypothetical protein
MLTSFVSSVAEKPAAPDGGGLAWGDVGLVVLGAALTLLAQFALEWRREKKAIEVESREEARAVDRESREEGRAIKREAEAARRELQAAALARQDTASEELDRLFAELKTLVVDDALDSTSHELSEKKHSALADVVPQAAYLDEPSRAIVLEMHQLLKWADEIAAHQNNSSGNTHYDHISTFCSTVANYPREVLAACLRRAPIPPLPDRIVEYRVAYQANRADREDIYAEEKHEHQAERAAWRESNPGYAAALELERKDRVRYLKDLGAGH